MGQEAFKYNQISPQEKIPEKRKLTPEQDTALRQVENLIKKTDLELVKVLGNWDLTNRLLSDLNKNMKELVGAYNLWGENRDIVFDELNKKYEDKEYLESSEQERISAYQYLKRNYFPLEIKQRDNKKQAV